jgi:DNA-binding FadR family transcriptional regulator
MRRRVISKRLSDQVEEQILDMIRSGEYPVDDHLPSERELTTIFDVGRSSVREALFSLERKGFVKISRGDRPKVARPSPDTLIRGFSDVAEGVLAQPKGILHFDQVRLLFECSLAYFAAEHATPEQIAILEAALRDNAATIGKNAKFRVTDLAFHRALAEMTENPIILGVHEALADWVIQKRVLIGDALQSNTASYAGHELVFRAIRDHDPTAAYHAMADHIARAANEYLFPNDAARQRRDEQEEADEPAGDRNDRRQER